jgi:NADH dehydrogenase
MDQERVLLIGGSGFVGSHVAQLLSQLGHEVTVPTRRRERAKDLLPLPTVDVVEASVQNPADLERLVRGQDAVINLVGILHSRSGTPYGRDFAQAHFELPRKIVAACRKSGVKRLLHVSALKAAKDAPSQYLRSKADGEAAVREGGPDIVTTVFQPSVIFGPGDKFLNTFAELCRAFPVLPLGCADARFQPVYVEDVAASIVGSISNSDSFGQTYELCGPKVYSLRELVSYAGELIHHRPAIVSLPGPLASLQAFVLELAPGNLMSRDNVRSMKVDNVCSGTCALPFGRVPTPLEAVAPVYLASNFPRARYLSFRSKARR